MVAEGSARATDGVFRADSVLAKHDEKYMPPEVADALKSSGHWQGEHPVGPEREAMIAELGHFALILALCVALVQSTVPLDRRGARQPAADGARRQPAALAQFALIGARLRAR